MNHFKILLFPSDAVTKARKDATVIQDRQEGLHVVFLQPPATICVFIIALHQAIGKRYLYAGWL